MTASAQSRMRAKLGHATTLMYALFHAGLNHMHCRDYAAANAQVDELIALADERGHRTGKQLEPYCGAGFLQ